MRLGPETSGLVFFDGLCGLCDRTVSFLVAKDRRRRLRFAPLQGKAALELSAAQRENLQSMVYWRRDGKVFERSAAVARALMAIGGAWAVAGAAMWLVPRPLRDAGYRVVASNRYQWFGKRETCRLPSVEERAVFLD